MKVWALFKKEMQTFFFSPVAYIVFAAYLLVVGILFFLFLASSKMATLIPLLHNAAFILLLCSPVLTMRLISEERKANTMELLLTSPVSPTQIILGKFLASWALYLVLIILTFQYPVTLLLHAEGFDLGPVYCGYLGMFLLSSAFIAVGLFASALTENQIISAMVSFGLLLFFWIIGWARSAMNNAIGETLSKLSLVDRFDEFTRGMLDSGNVIFFVIFTLIWLFLAVRVLESERWR